MADLEQFERAAARLFLKILELSQRRPSPVVLIDGRAGSGKSSLAKLLEDKSFKEFGRAPRIIHMDDLYPGWDGLRAGSLYLVDSILTPLRSRGIAEWQIWDWEYGRRGANDPGNGWRSFTGDNLLIVEGCGSISMRSADFADLCIWVDADLEKRKLRFLERDAGHYAEHWGSWSIQEDEYYESEKSRSLCDVLVQN